MIEKHDFECHFKLKKKNLWDFNLKSLDRVK